MHLINKLRILSNPSQSVLCNSIQKLCRKQDVYKRQLLCISFSSVFNLTIDFLKVLLPVWLWVPLKVSIKLLLLFLKLLIFLCSVLRMLCTNPLFIISNSSRVFINFFWCIFLIFFVFISRCLISVSYTHLDVYKRQVVHNVYSVI